MWLQVLDTTTAVKAEAATQYEAKLVAATETSDGLAAQLKEQQQAAQAAEAANSGLTADLTTCRVSGMATCACDCRPALQLRPCGCLHCDGKDTSMLNAAPVPSAALKQRMCQ